MPSSIAITPTPTAAAFPITTFFRSVSFHTEVTVDKVMGYRAGGCDNQAADRTENGGECN